MWYEPLEALSAFYTSFSTTSTENNISCADLMPDGAVIALRKAVMTSLELLHVDIHNRRREEAN